MKKIDCCAPGKEAFEVDGIENRGDQWKIQWDSAYTGYQDVQVLFCPFCGTGLPKAEVAVSESPAPSNVTRGQLTHELKIWPEFFDAVAERRKAHEIRRDDRGFQINDLLRLREWDPATKEYTRRVSLVRVTHITRNPPEGLLPGFVVMSIK